MKTEELLYKDEVYAIIGSAIYVHKELGPGFLEAVYHEALQVELTSRGIPYVSKKMILIKFKGHYLRKRYEADFICYDKILVEIKAQSILTSVDEAQLINYLKASGIKVGVLINFGSFPRLEWKRFIY
jgi:GxxExxY protein